MTNVLHRVRWVGVSLVVMATAALALIVVSPIWAVGPAPEPDPDPAMARARAQAKMLDDLFKVAVVDITNRYDGPPAAKVAKAIFAAAKDKKYFNAKLLDATGAPQNEANVPQDDFEKRAAKAMTEGQTYLEEVVGRGSARRLRVATVVPAVVQKCARCHGVKQGDLLGFLSYDLPVD
jgi:hypothetical protein